MKRKYEIKLKNVFESAPEMHLPTGIFDVDSTTKFRRRNIFKFFNAFPTSKSVENRRRNVDLPAGLNPAMGRKFRILFFFFLFFFFLVKFFVG